MSLPLDFSSAKDIPYSSSITHYNGNVEMLTSADYKKNNSQKVFFLDKTSGKGQAKKI